MPIFQDNHQQLLVPSQIYTYANLIILVRMCFYAFFFLLSFHYGNEKNRLILKYMHFCFCIVTVSSQYVTSLSIIFHYSNENGIFFCISEMRKQALCKICIFYSFFFYSNKNKTGLLLCKICILFLDLDMFLSDFERFTLMCGWVSKELCQLFISCLL